MSARYFLAAILDVICDRPVFREGGYTVYKGTLGYGIFFQGREVFSYGPRDFLSSRWYGSVEDAVNHLPDARLEVKKWAVTDRSKEGG